MLPLSETYNFLEIPVDAQPLLNEDVLLKTTTKRLKHVQVWEVLTRLKEHPTIHIDIFVKMK